MNVAVIPENGVVLTNEIAPILIFSLAFVVALGGAYAVAVAICGWGHVNMASVDFWKAQVKIQCK